MVRDYNGSEVQGSGFKVRWFQYYQGTDYFLTLPEAPNLEPGTLNPEPLTIFFGGHIIDEFFLAAICIHR